MPLVVNLRHFDEENLRLSGQLSARELDIETRDEVIQVTQPLDYDLEVQKLEAGLLIQGTLHLPLDCQCVRCLRPFQYRVELKDWSCHLPLKGEDAIAVVNDCVDLAAAVREDILLDFPRHPLCNPACRGLPKAAPGKAQKPGDSAENEASSPAWAELNKLKF